MATKQNLYVKFLDKEIPAYRHDENLGLFLDDDKWVGIHVKTGELLQGPSGRFKKKRACIKFLEHFENLDWDVTTEEELIDKNGGFEKLNILYKEAALSAMEVD